MSVQLGGGFRMELFFLAEAKTLGGKSGGFGRRNVVVLSAQGAPELGARSSALLAFSGVPPPRRCVMTRSPSQGPCPGHVGTGLASQTGPQLHP